MESKLLFMNNTLNLIGGEYNADHLVFDAEKKQFNLHQRLFDLTNGMMGFGIFDFKSYDFALLIGGNSHQKEAMDTLYSYSYTDCKWSKLDQTFPRNICFPASVAFNNLNNVIFSV